jgi:hypothetical protein
MLSYEEIFSIKSMDIAKNILITFLASIVLIGSCTYYQMVRDEQLRKNLKKSVAKITEAEEYYSKGRECRITIVFGEKLQYSLYKSILPKCNCNFYKDKQCLVVFDSTDIKNYRIFFHKSDACNFDYDYSLRLYNFDSLLSWSNKCE